MGKAGKWLKSFLTGKKEKERRGTESTPLPAKSQSAPIPVPSPKEKKRWSFRRSVAGGKGLNTVDLNVSAPATTNGLSESELEQKRHAMAVAVATAAAADAAVAAAQAAAAVVRLTAASSGNGRSRAMKEAAAVKIQAYFRSYLVLSPSNFFDLVRRQATKTLRRMQALVTAQARAQAQRLEMAEEAQTISQRFALESRGFSCPTCLSYMLLSARLPLRASKCEIPCNQMLKRALLVPRISSSQH